MRLRKTTDDDSRSGPIKRIVIGEERVVGLMPALPDEDGKTWVLLSKEADRSVDFLAQETYGVMEKRLLKAKGYREAGMLETMSCCHQGSVPEPVDSEEESE